MHVIENKNQEMFSYSSVLLPMLLVHPCGLTQEWRWWMWRTDPWEESGAYIRAKLICRRQRGRARKRKQTERERGEKTSERRDESKRKIRERAAGKMESEA